MPQNHRTMSYFQLTLSSSRTLLHVAQSTTYITSSAAGSHVPLQPLVFPHLVEHCNHLQAWRHGAARLTQHSVMACPPQEHQSDRHAGGGLTHQPSDSHCMVHIPCMVTHCCDLRHAQLPTSKHLLARVRSCNLTCS
jgi:hypothetical protein